MNSAVTSQIRKEPQHCPTRRNCISPPLHITAMKTTFLSGCEPVKVCPLCRDRTLHPRTTTGDIFHQRVYSKREVGLPVCAFPIYSCLPIRLNFNFTLSSISFLHTDLKPSITLMQVHHSQLPLRILFVPVCFEARAANQNQVAQSQSI